MRRNTSLFVLLFAVSAAAIAATTGCGDDNSAPTPIEDAGSANDGAPTTDGGPKPTTDGGITDSAATDAAVDGGQDAALLFTDYVKDLVTNHTADNTAPDDVYSHTFVTPDPEDPAAFPASFF